VYLPKGLLSGVGKAMMTEVKPSLRRLGRWWREVSLSCS
jgi:hypothetical protein